MSPSFFYESQYSGYIAGVDEVGMGSWVGPVYAAAAYVPPETPVEILTLIDDSKRLTLAKREKAYQAIIKAGLQVSIGSASLEEIEIYNIRGAAHLAMERAINQLQPLPDVVLVDGSMHPKTSAEVLSIIQGDSKSYSIGVASIIAKVKRDLLLKQLHETFLQYGWNTNAGYGTSAHQKAIALYGITPHHRKGYAPIRQALQGA